MVRHRSERQEDSRLRLMHIVDHNPQISSRQIAQEHGISNESAYYLLMSLIDKGFIKITNLNENSKKIFFYTITKNTYGVISASINERLKSYLAYGENVVNKIMRMWITSEANISISEETFYVR